MAPEPRARGRTTSRGARPRSVLARTLDPGQGDVQAKGQVNPFKVEHAQFLQAKLRSGSCARTRVNQRPPSALRNLKQRQREQQVLQALERLEDKHLVERAVPELEEVIANLSTVDDLQWFLRFVYDTRRPMASLRARREILLLLRHLVARFHGLCSDDPTADTMANLKERILPLLVSALKSSDAQDVVVKVLVDSFEILLPEASPDLARDGYVRAGRAILRALLEPLSLGMGWDVAVKQRCVSVLAAFTPHLLRKARQVASENGGCEVEELVGIYGHLLVQCLEVSPGLHQGLLQCLTQIASDEIGRYGLVSFAHTLCSLCASHLLETPSAAPAYASEIGGARSESPPAARNRANGALSRDLALVCCQCLRHLADNVIAVCEANALNAEDGTRPPRASFDEIRRFVLAALSRDNLNLHRLTRGYEPLRRVIALTRQSWESLTGEGDRAQAQQTPTLSKHSRNRGINSALGMRRFFEDYSGSSNEAHSKRRPSRVRSPAPDSLDEDDVEATVQAVAVDQTCKHAIDVGEEAELQPTIHPSLLGPEGDMLVEGPRRLGSQSWYLEARPAASSETVVHSGAAPAKSGKCPPVHGAGPIPRKLSSELSHFPISEAGPLPLPQAGITPAQIAVEHPKFSADFLPAGKPSLENKVLDYLAAGRADLAFQCVFQLGNEQSLLSLLHRLNPADLWPRLPESEQRYLVGLLVALICRDPISMPAQEACPWLESLIKTPKGISLLPCEELSALQGALFSLSGARCAAAVSAARAYYHLFESHQKVSALHSEFGPTPVRSVQQWDLPSACA